MRVSTSTAVVPDDAYVGESVRGDAVEQAADARTVHLHRDEIGRGLRRGDRRGGLAHSRPDLQNQGAMRPRFFLNRSFPVERQTILWKELLKRPLLCGVVLPWRRT